MLFVVFDNEGKCLLFQTIKIRVSVVRRVR